MAEEHHRHLLKLPIGAIKQNVVARPQVPCSSTELAEMLQDLHKAVKNKEYVRAKSTPDNPALSDDYIFTTEDECFILKDLREENFVGKVLDVGKGATKRKEQGLPQEYLYVFQYPCRLCRKDAEQSGLELEDVLLYIKINNRKVPYQKVIVISFHKNREKSA